MLGSRTMSSASGSESEYETDSDNEAELMQLKLEHEEALSTVREQYSQVSGSSIYHMHPIGHLRFECQTTSPL